MKFINNLNASEISQIEEKRKEYLRKLNLLYCEVSSSLGIIFGISYYLNGFTFWTNNFKKVVISVFLLFYIIVNISLYISYKEYRNKKMSEKTLYNFGFFLIIFSSFCSVFLPFSLLKHGAQLASLSLILCIGCSFYLFESKKRMLLIVYELILFNGCLFYFGLGTPKLLFYTFFSYSITIIMYYFLGEITYKLWHNYIVDRMRIAIKNEELASKNITLKQTSENLNQSLKALNEAIQGEYQYIENSNNPLEISYKVRDILKDLSQKRKELEKLRNSEKEFLAKMSHEIRTPLNAVIGISNLLKDTPLNSEQKDYIEAIQQSSQFLYGLISNVLDISKIEHGEMTIKPKVFDIHSQLKTLEKTFKLKLESKKIAFELIIDPSLKQYYITDNTLLNQVLINLLGNAEKYTQKGKIGLKAMEIESIENKAKLLFEVYDTGIGIDPKYHQSIFNKYKQTENESYTSDRGTGLGLSISKQIVELNGGRIYVESKLGHGSKFLFTFYAEYVKSDENNEKTNDNSKQIETASKLKYLIVEDNVMNLKYLENLLKKYNIEYKIALNGKLGWEAAQVEKFDIILMDLEMPEINGIECIKTIRKQPNINQNTIIIVLSASALNSQKSEAIQAGAQDFLSKPYTPKNFFEIIYKNVTPQDLTPTSSASNSVNNGNLINKDILLENNDFDIEMVRFINDTFWEKESQDDIENLLKNYKINENFEIALKLHHKVKPMFAMVGLIETYQVLESTYRELTHRINIEPNIEKVVKELENYMNNKNAIKEEFQNWFDSQ